MQHAERLHNLPRRVLAAVGPGDVVGLYRDRAAKRQPSFQVAEPYSSQLVDWCDQHGVAATIISWHRRADQISVGQHHIENLPKSDNYYRGGWRYYLGEFGYGLRLVRRAWQARAEVVIVDSGTTHWIALLPLRLTGCRLIAVLHSALWPAGHRPGSLVKRMLHAFDGFFFRRVAGAIVSISPECSRQTTELAGVHCAAIFPFLPTYRRGFLDTVAAPLHPGESCFHVLFLGRVERYKGVYEILTMARMLQASMPGRFAFRIIGAGPAWDEVKALSANLPVDVLPLLTSPAEAQQHFAWSHAMVVPTTSQFFEGLAMTAVESILAGRPVLVSTIVPAGELLAPAATTLPADRPEAFVSALTELATNPVHYDQQQRACAALQSQFYTPQSGLGAALNRAIQHVSREQ